ncbi:hypothetical protein [Ruficoccus sp. ZRK36]|uniref:hypothetical protein n=1 Tax=Ruficoccus sp. ZRK36 TaxID=2866311 RepID=UPI001C72BC24|nr:hypothetical protein [Ruficoccus sp. ZRK36]QYY36542.1 hypothetical protein K0V07_03505 [Ruficoccus sp. ZRK36]
MKPVILLSLCAACLLGAGCSSYHDDVGNDPISSTLTGNPDEASTYTDRVKAANQKRTSEAAENPMLKEGYSSGTNFDSPAYNPSQRYQ